MRQTADLMGENASSEVRNIKEQRLGDGENSWRLTQGFILGKGR